jgi:hypothetical protein
MHIQWMCKPKMENLFNYKAVCVDRWSVHALDRVHSYAHMHGTYLSGVHVQAHLPRCHLLQRCLEIIHLFDQLQHLVTNVAAIPGSTHAAYQCSFCELRAYHNRL